MRKAILIYYSRTGFTEQYARWFQEMTGCPIARYEDAKRMKLEPYEILIFASRFRAGLIQKLKWVNKRAFRQKEIIILATGAAPVSSPEAKRQVAVNLRECRRGCAVFYLESGLNCERLDRGEKALLKLIQRLNGTEAALESWNNSRRDYLKPAARFLKELEEEK